MGTLTTIIGHILNIANAHGTKQEQNYGAKQNASSRIGAADHESQLLLTEHVPSNQNLSKEMESGAKAQEENGS